MCADREILSAGQILAKKYRVGKRVGSGGYAIVYAGTRIDTEQPVVIKALRFEASDVDPAAPERFVREAAVAASLKHPNIVRILDFGRTRHEVLYIVMERLRGQTLADVIWDTPLSPGRVAHILRQILDALVLAHGQGMVHRDLKPANIFLCHIGKRESVEDAPQDWVKILDFGFAKGLESAEPMVRRTLTREGLRVGTPGYIAPEMLTADGEMTAKVDLYAVGIMGYEMLTARPAFDGEGWDRAILQATSEPAEPDEAITSTPLYPIVRKLLERDPDARYAAADAALRDLTALLDDPGHLWM